jgi:hypothetical protein
VFLHEHRERLFPDGSFSDLFAVVGRRSVVATVMVLQRHAKRPFRPGAPIAPARTLTMGDFAAFAQGN